MLEIRSRATSNNKIDPGGHHLEEEKEKSSNRYWRWDKQNEMLFTEGTHWRGDFAKGSKGLSEKGEAKSVHVPAIQYGR